jgi:small subunit ribosomal protein S20
MASHDSALKKNRHDRTRRVRNRGHLSKLRTELKKIRALITEGDGTEALKRLRGAESLLDHSATRGIIHRNAAARTKSRLVRQVQSLPRA